MGTGAVTSRSDRRRDWAALPTRVRVTVVVLSVAALALLSTLLMLPARELGMERWLPTVLAAYRNPEAFASDPAMVRDYLGMMAWLSLAAFLMLVDGALNLATCVLATARKDYPAGRDRSSWIAGLWAAFLLIQLPTGLASALVYWWFVARPARRPAAVS